MKPFGEESLNITALPKLSSGQNSCKWSFGNNDQKYVTAEDNISQGIYSLKDLEFAIASEQPNTTVLPPSFQNSPKCPAVFMQYDRDTEDLFVFRRRKLRCSGADIINTYPEKMLLLIFKWLPKYWLVRCAQVCKRWNRVAYHEALWQGVDLAHRVIDPGVLSRLILRGVSSLRLLNARITSPVFFPPCVEYSITKENCKLENVDLTASTIDLQDLEGILNVCGRLKRISLEQCNVISNICFHLSYNTSLQILNLAMCSGLDGKWLTVLVFNCLNLQSLNLSWTDLDAVDLLTICGNLPLSLRCLNLSGYKYILTDEHVNELSLRTPHLFELDLSDSFHLTIASIIIIQRNHQELQSLKVSRCRNIRLDAYYMLAELKNLKYIELHSVSDVNALSILKEKLPNVEFNTYLFSSAARPTIRYGVGTIWGYRVAD